MGYEEMYPCLTLSYCIIKKIGSGGEGVVFLASKRCDINKLVACKTISRGIEVVAREVEIMNMLSDCPGVLTLHEVIQERNSKACHLILDFCSSDLVKHVNNNEGGLSEKEAAYIVQSLAKTLKSMHSLGVIHRDVKPDNVLMTRECPPYEVKLSDFGLAMSGFRRCSVISDVVGTASCIAPEVLTDGEYSPACDVWGLGLIMYAILHGENAFSNKQTEVVDEQLKAQCDLPLLLDWSNITLDAKELILGMLTMDPEKRLTVDQILCHPWIFKFEESAKKKRKRETQ